MKIKKNNNQMSEVNMGNLLANKMHYLLLPILKNKKVHKETHLTVHKALIWPNVHYLKKNYKIN